MLPAEYWPEAGPSTPRARRTAKPPASWTEARKYAVIVDAGSSGSRLQVYSWKDAQVEKASRERVGDAVKVLPTVEKGTFGDDQDWQLKVEPGLSSFGTHPSDLHSYLEPLFSQAQKIIPSSQLASTPVYVLATAGMRLLPDEQRASVLKETCAYIQQQTPFKLPGGCNQHIQVITGEEEGLLGWIAINYLMDGFTFRPAPSAGALDATHGHSTFGFLDMGGASTQIAFEPSTKSQKAHAADKQSEEELSPVTLRMLDGTDVVHNVFVTTFLGYGTNRARDRYVQALSLGQKEAATLQDPCLPAGLEMNTAGDGANTATQKIIGSGNFDQCLNRLSPLLEKDATCQHPPCLFHGVHVPHIDFSVNHFIGVSEYWFSSNDVYSLGGAYDFVAFQKAAQDFCSRSWADLQGDLKKGTVFGKQVSESRLEMQCFKSAWMATVLHEGIGLPRIIDSGGKGDGKQHADDAQGKADEKNLFQSVNDVNGLSVSWTLGKAVLEASRDIVPAHVAQDAGEVGLPADSGSPPKSNEVASLPGQADPGIVQYKEHFGWSNQADLLSDAQQHVSEQVASHRFAVIVILGIVLLSILSCVVLRRRLRFKNFFSWPKSGSSRGSYALANMEEGSETTDGNANRGPREWEASISESSGEDEDDEKRRARRGLLTMVMVPLQRAALALGITSAAGGRGSPILKSSSRRHSRRMTNRTPMRYNASATPVLLSQPTSPRGASSLSRPASRAGALRSPLGGDGQHFNYFQQSGLGSPSLATTSARNSRAPSPAFGTHPTTPGAQSGVHAMSYFANAQRSNSQHQHRLSNGSASGSGLAGGSAAFAASPTPRTCRSGATTPTLGQPLYSTFSASGSPHRLVPQRAGTNYSRKAWEDD